MFLAQTREGIHGNRACMLSNSLAGCFRVRQIFWTATSQPHSSNFEAYQEQKRDIRRKLDLFSQSTRAGDHILICHFFPSAADLDLQNISLFACISKSRRARDATHGASASYFQKTIQAENLSIPHVRFWERGCRRETGAETHRKHLRLAF
jgi:hypothetical protein